MTIAPHSNDWENVDATAAPASLANYLNVVTALDAVKANKRRSYLLLGPQEGHRILDVGCGTGDDVLELAQMVGDMGEVIGIDNSQTFIDEARTKLAKTDLPARFETGNAASLDFADDTFDSCRSDRVFQHLANRTQALAEMMRVTRPGGRVSITDPDWGTIVVDMPDMALSTKVLQHWSDRHRNGWSGRQLFRLCKEAGLTQVIVECVTVTFTDFVVANQILYLSAGIGELEQNGKLSATEGKQWLDYLKEADRQGCFFSSLSGFQVVGTKA